MVTKSKDGSSLSTKPLAALLAKVLLSMYALIGPDRASSGEMGFQIFSS